MDLSASTRGSATADQTKVLIRTDSSNRIGTGHVSRCLRVAIELKKRGCEVSFVCANLQGNVSSWILNSGFKVLEVGVFGQANVDPMESSGPKEIQDPDATTTMGFAASLDARIVIVDHYGLDSNWEEPLVDSGLRVISIDDLDGRNHLATCVIRPGLPSHSSNDLVEIPAKSIQLSGLRYAVVSAEFCEGRNSRAQEVDAKDLRILVYFGGVDEKNFSERAVDSLLSSIARGLLAPMKVDLVLGARNSYRRALEIKYASNPFVQLHQFASSLAPLMNKCDVAIGAGGVTAFERVAAGLPSIVFSLAANQIRVCRALDELGLAIDGGSSENFRDERFLAMFRNLIDRVTKQEKAFGLPRGEIDCLGASRISETVMPSRLDELRIRLATDRDKAIYFGWVNDPLVRLQSLETGRIDYSDHANWFQNSLVDTGVRLLIIEVGSLPVGQVRFVRRADCWELNYSLDEVVRGRGWAKHMVKLALNWLKVNGEYGTVRAQVKSSNQASLRVLIDCGFKKTTYPASEELGILHLELKSPWLN